VSLLALIGCEFSTTKLPASPAELRVEIDVTDLTERRAHGGPPYTARTIRAVVRTRKGVAVDRPDVALLVNGVPLEFRAATGNYGERHVWYDLRDPRVRVLPDSAYAFTLVWPDGTPHAVGAVRTPKALLLSQLDLPTTHPRGRDLTIAWRELQEPSELVAHRGYVTVDSAGNPAFDGEGRGEPTAVRRGIGPRLFRPASGALVVPASHFADSGARRVDHLAVEVSRAATGEVRGPFLPDSYVRATRTVSLLVDVVDDVRTARAGAPLAAGR
jgi:hypothetical protein